MLYGWAIWSEAPSRATWLGAPLILAAGLIIVWREHRLGKSPAPTGTLAAPPG
jgi:drug/metabolite transporter (DMT)-like permease